MNSKPELRLDWCSFDAAKYACEHWHYSKSLPQGKTAKIGVWEKGNFIGVIVYGFGANQHLGKAFGLRMTQCIELMRVALKKHETAVSRIIAISLKILLNQFPQIELIISYADVDQGHHGGIYAASGWIYGGMVQTGGGTPKYLLHGKVVHGRTVHSLYGRGSQSLAWLRTHVDPKTEHVFTLGKHKYFFPISDRMKRQVLSLSKPYPKRATSDTVTQQAHQLEEGGSIPTVALNV
jgi:hypothetical protein